MRSPNEDGQARTTPSVFRSEKIEWIEPPGHSGGLSQILVSPHSHATEYFDFRVSRYPIGARVDAHSHATAEHVYYFLGGSGLLDCDEATHIIERGWVAFIPPGVVHSVRNTGSETLVFVVATSPPDDIPRGGADPEHHVG